MINGNTVAVKQLNISSVSPDVQKSLEMEVALLKTLNHENIVRYIDNFIVDGQLNIVMELAEAGSLAHLLRNIGIFPENLCKKFLRGVLVGLEYLHAEGVVHRDIKGGNILLTSAGTVKLADFGVSEKFEIGQDKKNSNDEEQAPAGTPYYMAPEVIQFLGAQPVSDIWSVGCTIIELITGDPPYGKLDPFPALFKMVSEGVPIPDSVSPALHDFLSQCFRPEPDFRPQATQLLQHPWLRIKVEASVDTTTSFITTIQEHAHQVEMVKEQIKQKTLTRADQQLLRQQMKLSSGTDSVNQSTANKHTSQSQASSASSSSSSSPSTSSSSAASSSSSSASSSQSTSSAFPAPSKPSAASPTTPAVQAPAPPVQASSKPAATGATAVAAVNKPAVVIPTNFEDVYADDADDDFDKYDVEDAGEEEDGGMSGFDDLDFDVDEPGSVEETDAIDEFADDPFAELADFAEDSEHDETQRIATNLRLKKFSGWLESLKLSVVPSFKPTVEMTASLLEEGTSAMSRADFVSLLSQQLVSMSLNYPELLREFSKQNALISLIALLNSGDSSVRQPILFLLEHVVHDETNLIGACMMGGIPVVAECAADKFPIDQRVMACKVIYNFATGNAQSLQMYAACGGLPILTYLLTSNDIARDHDVILLALRTVRDFFQSGSHLLGNRSAFLHVCLSNHILVQLEHILLDLLTRNQAVTSSIASLLIDVLQLFVRAEITIKIAVIKSGALLSTILRLLEAAKEEQPVVVRILDILKDLSAQNETIHQQMRPAISALSRFVLPYVHSNRFDPLIFNPIIHCLFNLSRLNAEGQLDLVQSGGLGFIKYVIDLPSYGLRDLAGQLLCELASNATGIKASNKNLILQHLHKNNVEPYLFNLLSDRTWHVDALQGIKNWSIAQPDIMRPYLIAPTNLNRIVEVFHLWVETTGTDNSLKNLVESLTEVIRFYPDLKEALAQESSNLIATLVRMFKRSKAAFAQAPILRLLRTFLCDEPVHPGILKQAGLNQLLIEIKGDDRRKAMIRTMAGQIIG